MADLICLWVGRVHFCVAALWLLLTFLNWAGGFALRSLGAQKEFVVFLWARNAKREAERG